MNKRADLELTDVISRSIVEDDASTRHSWLETICPMFSVEHEYRSNENAKVQEE
jgi:hypothetical protein